MIITLDLHYTTHEDAKIMLDKLINNIWKMHPELHIITGHSKKMKEIVIDILKEYKLDYNIGDFSGRNTGYIRTTID